MKILIFTEGTAIMHAAARGVAREERVRQSATEVTGINDFRSYVPNGNVVEKLQRWKSQGAEIYYLTSRTKPNEVADVEFVLKNNNFPDTQNLLFRKDDEEYKDVAEMCMPDILIEDDCESIGGESEMTYPHIDPTIQSKIVSIVTKEFGGIDDLPDDIHVLKPIEGRLSKKEV